MTRTTASFAIATCLSAGLATSFASAQTTTTDFSSGAEGWVGPTGIGGATTIEPSGGNSGAYMRTQFNDFGVTFRNSTNSAFLGDYTTAQSVTISIDVEVDFLNFFGQDVSRPWLVELRDFDTAQGGYPWTSAWFLFDNISQAEHSDWTTFSVTFDPNATDLPSGWGGYGDEDPNTFEPILPSGVTFQDVMMGVDEIVFTTLQPGFFFGFTDHTIGIDNITLSRENATCDADWNNSGGADIFDILDYLADWQALAPETDLTGEGTIDIFDILAFLSIWDNGCP